MSDTTIPVGATGKELRGFDTGAGIDEYVRIANPDPIAVDASGSTILESSGTFAYRSGSLTAGSVTLTGSLRNLRIYAVGADASLNIGGGDTITVRSDTGFDVSPRSTATDLVLNWVSGTMDYFAEVV